MQEGPMKEHTERETTGLINSEYITYRVKDGVLVKETSLRHYTKSGDYNDSYISEPLVEVK